MSQDSTQSANDITTSLLLWRHQQTQIDTEKHRKSDEHIISSVHYIHLAEIII